MSTGRGDRTVRDTSGSRATLTVGDEAYEFFRLDAVPGTRRLPFSLKVLLENVLRNEDGVRVTAEHVRAVAGWDPAAEPATEVQFTPARVLLQDIAGIPSLINLAMMRDAMFALGRSTSTVDPLLPVDLVVDHSVTVDEFGTRTALHRNVELEYERNRERYQFLRWAQRAFGNLTVMPPGTGIIHQVNLEHLARVVFTQDGLAYPDTLIATDSHTTMVNGLGVLGWGVGGIEAEAAMLGQPVSMLVPRVVGVRLTGELPVGSTATDLVLTITALLRRHGVVGKFVEFYGDGIASVPLANRATIGNMSPEYGSTCAIFPIDEETIRYLRLTGRDPARIALVEAYAKEQGLWHDPSEVAQYSEHLELDLSTVVPSLAGPHRPQDTVPLAGAKLRFRQAVGALPSSPATLTLDDGAEHRIDHGAVVVAAITSCTNTSNPSLMVAAGLLARNAVERGLQRKPWVKTSLAPGSKVVTDYYERAGLTPYLEKLGFHVVGYGCTTCVGNSGPLPAPVGAALRETDLAAVAVLSGNRNFEARVHPDVRMNYLASPPLVVAYALAGTMDIDLTAEPLGHDPDGAPVFLADIWPSPEQVQQTIDTTITSDLYRRGYADLDGDERWQGLAVPTGDTYAWDEESTYLRRPPYLDDLPDRPSPVHDIRGARVLAKLGDSVTTDHISPVGAISPHSPAATYLLEHGVAPRDFNSYGSRRGNHEVMVRGTFANRRLRNQLVEGTEGGFTRDFTQPGAPVTTIYDAAMAYRAAGAPLIVLAGAEYGTGSSRDWAAKGSALLGVRAVIARSFERIHRSNLIGMGILPLQFADGEWADTLGLDGTETFDIEGIESLNSKAAVPTSTVVATAGDGRRTEFTTGVRLDTPAEVTYYRHGGIMPFVLRSLAAS